LNNRPKKDNKEGGKPKKDKKGGKKNPKIQTFTHFKPYGNVQVDSWHKHDSSITVGDQRTTSSNELADATASEVVVYHLFYHVVRLTWRMLTTQV